MKPFIECVPNFSEGRDLKKVVQIEQVIAAVPEVLVLHRTSDADHNRSVITFAGPVEAVLEAAIRAAEQAKTLINLQSHRGVHPRLGALDVLPFVPLEGTTLEDCVSIAHRAGERIWQELGVPVYFYEAAALSDHRRKLEDVRRGEFEELFDLSQTEDSKRPDVGGPGLHPIAGAVIVGARKFLIAYNINLHTPDLAIAKEIARKIRTSSGGFPAVKALGLQLISRGQAQVSMNLTDFETTSILTVFREVKRLAGEQDVMVAESELIGLVPRKALSAEEAIEIQLADFDADRIVENRIERLLADG